MTSWNYEPSIQSTSVVNINEHYGHYIAGKLVTHKDSKTIAVTNPATEEQLSTIEEASQDVVEEAVKAAKEALKPWQNLSPHARARYLYLIGRELEQRKLEFATLETMDNGKPISESLGEDIPLASKHFTYYAGWADKIDYAFPGSKQKAVGVVGQIIPWNFPLLMLAWKLAPALAAGNTVVLKPASETPLSAMLFTTILDEIGLPPGVVNIVNGSGSVTGNAIVTHPDIDKIAFTGSTQVGAMIQKNLGGSRKRLTLELGGKGANIVFADAPIDQAIEGVVNGIFFNQGEVCCAGSRLLVEESIAESFIDRLTLRIRNLKVGNPLDYHTQIGAINSRKQYEKISKMIACGVEEGAKLIQSDVELPEMGYFIPPTLFADVTPNHTIAREEIFGPVLSIMTFRTPDEAVEIANNTRYGLANGVWSSHSERLVQVSRALESGVVWNNTYNLIDPASPFGGVKQSGFGREGGLHGLLPYLRVR